MERMSDEQLDKRIQSFMERKLEKFPELDNGARAARRDSQSLVTRLYELAEYVPHLHGPRRASIR